VPRSFLTVSFALALALIAGCATERPPARRPSILLVTLDTTRADAVAAMPRFAELAARGVRFTRAFATAPMTLPSHASMLTGLYPAGHGVHENGRPLAPAQPVLTAELAALGYETAAFVSGFPLAREFGLARGFARYDDDFGAGAVERPAAETTRRALDFLRARDPARPLFLWVHYYDPHDPYQPPRAFRGGDPYLGEVRAMDAALGDLLAAWSGHAVVAGDHGEGRGEHGEALHGNLLYQGVMAAPLALVAPGLAPEVRRQPVSLRQIHPTVLGWAGTEATGSLLAAPPAVVLAEAMQPYLNYRWQPQVMAVEGAVKAIRSGSRVEIYDLDADPGESRDLAAGRPPSRALRAALAEYPLPGAAAAPVGDEARRRLASLGYVVGGAPPRSLPATAPHASDMTDLLAALEEGSALFTAERYAESIPVHERVLARDPGNLMVAVRIAVAQSLLGRDEAALRSFERARRIDPESIEARHYLALHLLRTRQWDRAAELFEAVVAAEPLRVAALSGLGKARMERGETAGAIAAFEQARSLLGQPASFDWDLELGVLYLAARRFEDARDALDRVEPRHPGYAMALFKRAQVSVLLNEPDRGERVREAWERADATTRPLIGKERLFAGLVPG
jgi:tetratricopeptide (TPR) repeat protein